MTCINLIRKTVSRIRVAERIQARDREVTYVQAPCQRNSEFRVRFGVFAFNAAVMSKSNGNLIPDPFLTYKTSPCYRKMPGVATGVGRRLVNVDLSCCVIIIFDEASRAARMVRVLAIMPDWRQESSSWQVLARLSDRVCFIFGTR